MVGGSFLEILRGGAVVARSTDRAGGVTTGGAPGRAGGGSFELHQIGWIVELSSD
jgi:hypothetical protein